MTIHWNFKTVTETRTDEDGNEYETEIRGPIQVWFHDADPASDPPQQTVDWQAMGLQPTTGADVVEYPIAVKRYAAKAEIDGELSGNQPFNKRVSKIYRDLMTEQIEKR